MGTFKPVLIHKRTKTIGTRWVFKVKTKADGTYDKHKARLVAKGYSQIKGINFNGTYAPVAKIDSP